MSRPLALTSRRPWRHLNHRLSDFGYTVETIKVTDIFREIDYCDVDLQDRPSEKRFRSYIDFGNRLREITANKAICASLVINKIAKSRGLDPAARTPPRKTGLQSFISLNAKKKSTSFEVFTVSYFSKFQSIHQRENGQILLLKKLREITKAQNSIGLNQLQTT